MQRATSLVGRGALILALTTLAACASPPKPDAERPGDSATVNGWVTTGTFQ